VSLAGQFPIRLTCCALKDSISSHLGSARQSSTNRAHGRPAMLDRPPVSVRKIIFALSPSSGVLQPRRPACQPLLEKKKGGGGGAGSRRPGGPLSGQARGATSTHRTIHAASCFPGKGTRCPVSIFWAAKAIGTSVSLVFGGCLVLGNAGAFTVAHTRRLQAWQVYWRCRGCDLPLAV